MIWLLQGYPQVTPHVYTAARVKRDPLALQE
jgi:hypothetical protein